MKLTNSIKTYINTFRKVRTVFADLTDNEIIELCLITEINKGLEMYDEQTK